MKRHWFARLGSALLVALVLLSAALSAGSVTPTQAAIDPALFGTTNEDRETTVWLIFRDQADLSQASSIQDWTARGQYIVKQLQGVAQVSQAQFQTQAQTIQRNISFEPYWIINAVRVTADEATIKQLASLPEVAEVLADRKYSIPEPEPADELAVINAIEWNIDRIRAPQVWSTFGTRGEGVVVANIDSGVQYNHPALVGQYRGRQSDGTFNHNYNWFDPSRTCANPSLVPCDNNGHGTHTMGTMVGSDGTNQIGVAPGARWIAAKGCETTGCSLASLLATGQWVLAPTDLNGQNPRADLRPQIVNNSWGGDPNDTFYQAIVRSWVAAGIFPVFSNGNEGPACNTAGSPGDYPESYAVGSFDINNAISSFSSRGSSALAGIKPNISAPGSAVRSSVPNNSYASYNGTSMAAPHVAGTVALIWSAAPALAGDVEATKTLLNRTAIDVDDTRCGGTAANNNVWGEGRLDAFAAVDQAPRGATGVLAGQVTASGSNTPIAGATVQVTGVVTRTAATDTNGNYSLRLPVGSFNISAVAFGYSPASATGVTVSDGVTTTRNLALVSAPRANVSGTVRDSAGRVQAGATISIPGTPITPVTTDANGRYLFSQIPHGSYQVSAVGERCLLPLTLPLVVDGNETLDITLQSRMDSFGYSCRSEAASYVEAGTVVPLTGDDAAAAITLPFPFRFYGKTYTTAYASTNGFINFLASVTAYSNRAIPLADAPNASVYAVWDDLLIDSQASVRTQLVGTAPRRSFVIEWRNATFYGSTAKRIDAEIILYENGQIVTQYRGLDDSRERGESASTGIENETGTVGLQYSFNEVALSSGLAIHYRPLPVADVAFLPYGRSEWRQGIYVVGSRPELGAWDATKALALNGDEYPYWSALISLPPNTEVEYKYIKIDIDGEVTYEPGPSRTFTTPGETESLALYDEWGLTLTQPATFTLANVPSGATGVYLSGNLHSLGAGDPEHAPVLLNTEADPTMRVTINLPILTRVEYKYFIRNSAGEVVWERGGNRSFTTKLTRPTTRNDTWRP